MATRATKGLMATRATKGLSFMAPLVIEFVVMDGDAERREDWLENSPQVVFALDPELDVRKINGFWASEGKRRRGPADFRQCLVEAHPGLIGLETLSPSGRDAKIGAYVQGYYREHADRLSTAASGILQEWGGYAPQFFAAAGKIFRDLRWPPGKYTGFVSICPPFPRFLHDKTFQVPDGLADRCIRVTAHEMLHFLFYEYVRRRYFPQMANTVEKEMDREMKGRLTIPVWELSEIFDIAVLTPENFGIGGSKTDRQIQYSYYQHLEPYVSTFEKAWREAGGDIDRFFGKLEVEA